MREFLAILTVVAFAALAASALAFADDAREMYRMYQFLKFEWRCLKRYSQLQAQCKSAAGTARFRE